MIARLRADTRILPVLAAIVIAFGLLARGNATFTQAGTYIAIYAIAAIGLSILLGNVRQISVGQAGFFGIGAYATGYFTTTLDWPFWGAAAIGIALAAIAGLGLGFIALRFRGHYLAMATLAFGLIAAGVFHASSALGGASGITGIAYPRLGTLTISGYAAYWFAWLVAGLVAVASLNLLRGRTGRAFEAIRNDEFAAEAIGVPTRRYKIVAFAYAGALAAVAGAIYASFLGLVNPDAVGVGLSIDVLLMVVLGGSGTVSGAIVGAVLIGYLNVVGHQFQNWREVAYGALVVVFVVAAPTGIIGLLRSLARRVRGEPPAAAPAAVVDRGLPVRVRAPAAVPLAVRHVVKRFGGLLALDDVSFELEPGTLTSLIGPNGAGKTTLFNAICGIGRVTSGSVEVAGQDVTGWQPHRVAALGVGRTFQNARLFGEMTVLENVVAGALRAEPGSFAGDLLALAPARRADREATQRARATLVRLGLEHVADVDAKQLPFGVRRRVELARALAADPWMLLVDEPAAGLNAGERAVLHDDLLALREAGTTLLLVEHDMALVMAISQRILVLDFGRLIADGDAQTVRRNAAVVAAYLGSAS